MPFVFGSKGSQNQWGFQNVLDKYNAPIVTPSDTVTGLKTFLQFESAVNATGGAYTTGTVYVSNSAPGAVNTSDTTGDLYKAFGTVTIGPSYAKYGLGGGYFSGGTIVRNVKAYTFPQNTGITFSIWVNNQSQSPYSGALFGYSDSTSTNQVALRLISIPGNLAAPWNLNYQIDNYVTENSNGVGTTLSPGVSLNANTWYHIAWTISPAAYSSLCTYTFYLNGQVVKTSTGANIKYPKNVARTFIDVGGEANNGSNKGYIDNYRFYERCLTADDMLKVYSTSDPSNII